MYENLACTEQDAVELFSIVRNNYFLFDVYDKSPRYLSSFLSKPTMSDISHTIVLEVLRAASREVLGTSKELSVALPCQFSNARGNLRTVKSIEEIQAIAEKSANRFMAGLRTAKAISNG